MNFLYILYFSTFVIKIYSQIISDNLMETFGDIAENVIDRIGKYTDEIADDDIPEDGKLNFTELANKYGYHCEEFDVTTKDGYILKLFHIPGDKSRAVLLNHGVIDTSDTFIIRSKKSLALTLASLNYDVWAMNQRGNRYARKHTTLDPDLDSREFFNYSFNEVGIYDIPANVDFILEATKANKISYIGNSQGTSSFFVMASEIPDYNDKIDIAIMFAPIAFVRNIEGLCRATAPFTYLLNDYAKLRGINELAGYQSNLSKVIRFMCSKGKLGFEVCKKLVFETVGYDPKQLEQEFFRIAIGHFPAGTNVKSLTHYGQMFLSKKFQKFDYGEKNMEYYGSKMPPEYDLRKVRVKVALFRAKNDRISTMKDVAKLKSLLPNVVEYRLVKNELWTHLDYTWAKDIDKYLHPYVIDFLNKYSGL